MTREREMKHPRLKLALTSLLLLAGHADGLDIANNPLFVAGNLAPNLVLTLDDSGSMRRAYVPEVCGDSSDCDQLANRWTKSAQGNGLYYDPTEIYDAPRNADGSSRSTSFSAAWRNGFYISGSAGGLNFATTVDLGSAYQPSANLDMQAIPPERFMGRDVETKGSTGTNSSFTIGNFQNVNGSAGSHNPGSNLLSVVVNGTIMSRGGASTSSTCASGRPSGDKQFTTYLSGSTLTLCFRQTGSDLPIQVSYLRSDAGPAYYNLFNSNRSGCSDPVAQKRNNACYDTVIVGTTSGPGGRDERQNFANWYSFWRTRNLATISAASLTFANLGATTRVAWQALNTCRGSSSSLVTNACQGWTGSYGSNAIRDFGNGTQRGNFYNWLFKLPSSGGTPLRESLKRVGEYFRTTGENSPYDNDFTTANSGQYSCRRNFHVMMTDGIWNDADVYQDYDARTQSLPDGSLYNPSDTSSGHFRIFADRTAQTLSDLAFYYWLTDLSSLANDLVPVVQDEDGNGDGIKDPAGSIYWNPKNNPATWQHMVNFTIGLGLTEFLAAAGLDWNGDMYGGSYPRLQSGAMAWPPASSAMGDSGADYGKSAHDLWHAAINSRGRFFSVDSPRALQESFEKILSMVETATPTAAALASSTNTTGQAGDKTRLFQARFDTRNWDGHLYALEVDAGNAGVGSPLWDAAAMLPAPAARNLFMNDGSVGRNFTWNNLSNGQKAALDQADGNGSLRLDWLRGDHSREQRHSGGLFRNRTSFGFNYDGTPRQIRSEWVLGDIVSSDPLYVGTENQHYELLSSTAGGKNSYASYVESKKRRTPMIYVGANDGMLHALRASDGVEQFALIPSAIFPRLHLLTRPGYSHRFYVDGSPGAGDAYLNGSWKTVVVSGLRAGGKSVLAVDATAPDKPAPSQFMWEFNAGESDADMGYSYSQPQVVRLNNGKWAAVFGNGYGSSNGGAHLYLVDLADGSLITKIEATRTGTDNGLSTPNLIDSDGDRTVDVAYAGDLQGNLWKFDLSSSSATGWKASKLFTAQDDSGKPQPITVQPTVATGDGGRWIFLGTGRLLANGDQNNSDRQSFYGLWDNRMPIGSRNALVKQQVTDTMVGNGSTLRLTTDNAVDLASKRGWYLDLPGTGERVIAEATAAIDNLNPDDNRIIFTTALPSADPCNAQGASWLMELSFKGQRPARPVFDLNQDLKFDSGDEVRDGVVPTGMQSTVGMMESVTWLDKDAAVAFKLAPGTKGAIQTIANRGRGQPTPRRVSWQQLM